MRTALVTGASSGIGAATAARLAADGWQVVAAARRLDRLGELSARCPGVRPVALDVTDPQSVAALVDAVPELDLLVANAGGAFGHGPVGTVDVERWQRTFDVNVLGTVRTVQAVLPQLEASRGHVVLTGSTAGIRVSEVAPGMVQTEEFSLVRFDGDEARAAAVYAGVEALTADDVADCIAWVAGRPAHVNVDLVVVTPQQQAGVGKVVRR
jgi:NADP-dependent 3-hydroxy acid dehydrogenase YdfG